MTKRRIAVLEEACKVGGWRETFLTLVSAFLLFHLASISLRMPTFSNGFPLQAAEARAREAEESLEVIVHAASGK
jgi:hypothetical protein